MKITMLASFGGKFDGVVIGPFTKGKDCEVEYSLAEKLIKSSMAIMWKEPAKPSTAKTK